MLVGKKEIWFGQKIVIDLSVNKNSKTKTKNRL